MATAVEPSSTPPSPAAPGAGSGLVFASLVGAVYVIAALAAMLYGVPKVWELYVAPAFGANRLPEAFLRWAVVLAALVVLIRFGLSLAGANPPKGLRGGIFLMLVTFALAGLLTLWIGSSTDGNAGKVVTAIVLIALAFGAFRLFTSPRGEAWMVALEEQGWFHGAAYKRVLGRLVRRLTILGILIVGGTGVYSLWYQGSLPEHWEVTVPFSDPPQMFRLLPDAKYTVPLLLFALTVWVAWRAVNVPAFAEFLIATEAEMNKVSWSSRKRLAQDTVVVLVCTIVMALFLLAVDLFWGWLLSRDLIGILPSTDQTDGKGQVRAARW